MALFNFFSKIPGWVKGYPDEDDRDALKSMVKSGADLDDPREMVFCIYASHENANQLVKAAKQKGWQSDVQPTADPDPEPGEEYFVEIRKDGYVLTHDAFTEDKQHMLELSKRYDAAYDGWYASV